MVGHNQMSRPIRTGFSRWTALPQLSRDPPLTTTKHQGEKRLRIGKTTRAVSAGSRRGECYRCSDIHDGECQRRRQSSLSSSGPFIPPIWALDFVDDLRPPAILRLRGSVRTRNLHLLLNASYYVREHKSRESSGSRVGLSSVFQGMSSGHTHTHRHTYSRAFEAFMLKYTQASMRSPLRHTDHYRPNRRMNEDRNII